jgi:hypothetical protein
MDAGLIGWIVAIFFLEMAALTLFGTWIHKKISQPVRRRFAKLFWDRSRYSVSSWEY